MEAKIKGRNRGGRVELEIEHLQELAGLTLCNFVFDLCLLQKWPQPNTVTSQYYTHPTM